MVIFFYEPVGEIANPTHARHYRWADWRGVPFFWGVSCFGFQGQILTLDIYSSMANQRKEFNKALTFGLTLSTTLLMATGILTYHGFGQFTTSLLFANLSPEMAKTYLIKVLFGVGVICGSTIQMSPLWNLFDRAVYTRASYPMSSDDIKKVLYSYVLRAGLVLAAVLLGY